MRMRALSGKFVKSDVLADAWATYIVVVFLRCLAMRRPLWRRWRCTSLYTPKTCSKSETVTESVSNQLVVWRAWYMEFQPASHVDHLSCVFVAVTQNEDIQTLYLRLEHGNGEWVWFHTRGKLVFKNSKKYSIVFTHCPVRWVTQLTRWRHRYMHARLYKGCDFIRSTHCAPCVS